MISDPSKESPDVPKTLHELIQEFTEFTPDDAVIFAEEPHTMVGMLIHYDHEVDWFDHQGNGSLVHIPAVGVDLLYDENTVLKEITVHDPERKAELNKGKDFDFDDFIVTEEESENISPDSSEG